jgi:hypothetical protein
MGLVTSIKKFFAQPKHITRFDELDAGPAVIDGDVRASDGEPLLSPIKSQACVAFVYRAAHKTPGRGAGMQDRPLRSAEGFRPFELELDGGRIEVVPQTPGDFTREDHQKLASAGYPRFHAEEVVVPLRARVRLRGTLKEKGGAWVLTFRRVEVLKPEPGAKKTKRKK